MEILKHCGHYVISKWGNFYALHKIRYGPTEAAYDYPAITWQDIFPNFNYWLINANLQSESLEEIKDRIRTQKLELLHQIYCIDQVLL